MREKKVEKGMNRISLFYETHNIRILQEEESQCVVIIISLIGN